MKIDKEQYKKIKIEVEADLRNYQYDLIAIQTPGPTNRADNECKKILVNAIKFVYDKLDKNSKRIIECSYFGEDVSVFEVMEELKVDKNKYYKIKNDAIYKFAIGLGYC